MLSVQVPTYNQQVRGCTVHPCFIGANAGDVPCVCEVHSGDGQYALYVQPILSTRLNLLLNSWLLKTKTGNHYRKLQS